MSRIWKINMKDIGQINIAITNNDMISLKELLNEHPECLKYSDSSEGTLLHVAAEEGNVEAIKYLLSLELDMNKCAGAYDANALIPVISAKQIEAVKYLINKRIKLDTSTSLRNPLIAAIDTNQDNPFSGVGLGSPVTVLTDKLIIFRFC